ncbi:MFS transporter [Schaalia sp. lx-260]|uniref:MFS transporter n=1 Tax=Schaalia sp. lx-260 TaxID=2899082 RepID=UPI001E3F99C0|nr:MFS transporter [Schaalia sp. lx-260]MCD4549999.1 MFS transporter [Schaalia sp. lx-260]
MFSAYSQILKIPGAARFSLAGAVLRTPMSMMGISTILSVKAIYGNYTIAGLLTASSIVAAAITAPILARLVDRHGQLRTMGPSLTVCGISVIALITCFFLAAPLWLVFIFSIISGATSGSPGALVRSRWLKVTASSPTHLPTAYALESAIDELIYIVGPILATILGASIHPTTGLVLSALCTSVGGYAFLSQRSTEPTPMTHTDEHTSAPSVLRDPAVIVLVLTYIGAGALFGANDVSVIAFAEEQGAPAYSGILLAVFALGSLCAALIYGSRTWLHPLWKLFAVGVFALALGVSTFLCANNLWVLGTVMLISGLTCAPTLTNVNMIITKIVRPQQLTEGLAWMSTSLTLGVSLGSAVAGPAIDSSSSYGGFIVMVIFAWIMVAVMLAGLSRLRRGVEKPAMQPSDLLDA